MFFCFQAEDGIRDLVRSRGLGDVYKRQREQSMKITYDAEVDVLYIQFVDATVTTEQLADGIAADYDEGGRLAGIEILDALQRFRDPRVLRQVILEDVGLSHA